MIWICFGDMNKSGGHVSRAPNNTHCSENGEGCGGGSSSLHLIYFSGARFPFRVAGGLEGVEEAGGEIDFTGEEAARGLLATVREIGHSKVLLELVMHRFEIFC